MTTQGPLHEADQLPRTVGRRLSFVDGKMTGSQTPYEPGKNFLMHTIPTSRPL